ncbi:PREDICTED: mediator of DNA damage checkpoint protein 1 [Elephantulus edwardii]|uniref:mediator of DNA damage checkpoint protein 1 n=1 Tax=Elephantulus edwardii TaxID=28737 RepID=UPI0003F072DA|nr:PREDICTED: mediator of DNA damage checkpoint protein 1 [Elephantulus edwardii]
MEDTQVIDWESEEEETEISSDFVGSSLEPLGRLHIFSSTHGPEKDFLLYLGENVVGRMPDCAVTLPFPSVSKQHAVIEIVAWDKAPILRDCGSLNGTQVLKPHKVLTPGVTHRLKDQQFILFADLLCQYHRLDIPLPVASRAPLIIEETPKVQGGTQSHGLLLAEDSEEEVDSLSKSCLEKKSRTTSSPLATTVVPESDEEGASFVMNGPTAPCAFNLDSDTDEEEGQHLASEEASASRRGFPTEAEQPDADGIRTKLQLENNWTLVKKGDGDTRVEKDRGKAVVPVKVMLERSLPADEDSDTDVDEDNRPPGKPPEGHLERAQPSNFIDSDTDVEEVIPATPNVVLMNKKQIFPVVGMNSSGVPTVAQLQKSQRGGDAHVEPGEAQPVVHLKRGQASMVINSDTDDEEEVSAALTLAHLKESRAVTDHRDISLEEARAPAVGLLGQNQTSAEKDSDTDVEEEKQPIIKGHTHKGRALVNAHSGNSQTLLRDSDEDVQRKKSSPGDHLERRQVTTTLDSSPDMEEEGPLETAIVHLEKYQAPVEGTHQTDVKTEESPVKLPVVHLKEIWPPQAEGSETDNEEDMSFMISALADVRKSQLPAEGDAGTERASAVLKRERAFERGSQGGSPIAQVEQDLLPLSRENLTDLVVGTGTPGDLSQPHRKGALTPIERKREPRAARANDFKSSLDDSEDLDLQATQCFMNPRENPSLAAIQSMEDEPTQAFLCTLPREEPGPSYCSIPIPGRLSCKMTPTEKAPKIRASPHSPKIEDIKVEDRSEFTSEPQLKSSPSDKRTEAIKDSPPPQKRPRRGQIAQKTEIIKKEEEDPAEMPGKQEDVVIPVSDKRKRDQSEEESTKTQRLSLRQRKSNQEATPPKVLFTGVVDARGERAVLALGGSLASSVTEASHLVTDRICRTVKFLCALGRGIPILSQDWLYQSRKAGCFLPPDEYVVTDPEQEKNFGFNLRDALSRAQKQRLLEGYEIHVTPGVQPPPPQMAEIISCCGGTVLPHMPRSYKPRRVVITCSQDFPRCSIPFRVGLPLLSSEFLLTGVLKQEANPEAFILSTREMSST